MEKTSIIFVHHSSNKNRVGLAIESLNSLYESVKHLPVEIIVVDNGGDWVMSAWFNTAVEENKITHYIHNSSNVWFGYGRNQAVALSSGEILCFVDNDIIYAKGWLDECLEILRFTRGTNRTATPLAVDRAHRKHDHYLEPLHIRGVEHVVNRLAGSNCWAMWRSDFYKVGEFTTHPIAGTQWQKTYSRLGYGMVLTEIPMAVDRGFYRSPYQGYSKKSESWDNIIKKWINGDEEYLFGK